jgi:hypothetical protein
MPRPTIKALEARLDLAVVQYQSDLDEIARLKRELAEERQAHDRARKDLLWHRTTNEKLVEALCHMAKRLGLG